MADYYLVPGSAKMHILTNGKGSFGSGSAAIISSANVLNVGASSSTTSNIAAYGAYYTNGYTVMQIPAGSTSTRPTTAGPGYLRYNTDNTTIFGDVIEYYRGLNASWLPLYSPPQLNTIDVSAAVTTYIPRNAAGTQYLNLRGYNFEKVSTPLVFFYGFDGSTNFISPSVTWNSYNWVVAQVPTSVYTGTSVFIASVSPYSVRITSSISGMSQTLVNALSVGADPIFNQSQTNPLTLPYFNSRSYTAGAFNAGTTGTGIGNYISAFVASGQPILFSIDATNNSQYAPYNLDLSWNPVPSPDANGNYYAYFITKPSQTIPGTAVSTPTTITLGVVATNTVTSQLTKGAFKIVINPYYIVANFSVNANPLSGSVTVSQAYVTNSYPGYYTSLYNATTNTTPTYTTNSYGNGGYPTTWTTPSSRTTFTYNFIVTSLGCPGTIADPSNNNIVDFLLVGGGGGGGNGYQSGGGGAGGLISSNANFGGCGGGGAALTTSGYTISSTGTYVIQVGGGGAGANFQTSTTGTGLTPLSGTVTNPSWPAFQGDNTTFFGLTAAGGGYGAGEMNYANNNCGNNESIGGVPPTTTGVTSPLQGSTNQSATNGSYGTLSTISPSGTNSGNPWCVGPSLYNPRCDWNPLAGGCGGGGSHGQLTQLAGLYGASGNYNPTVYLSGATIIGPISITGSGSTQGYGGGSGVSGGPYVGGGGGGAGGAGANANTNGTPGVGGNGSTNSITGTSTTYACGGGGASRSNPTGGSSFPVFTPGGSSSVNNGQGYNFYSPSGQTPTPSQCNGNNGTGTGGGGWGCWNASGNLGQAGNGGNGIAVIRYPRVSGVT